MFEGGRRNRVKIYTPNKGYGVVVTPEPVYKYPKDHPCRGCVFVFQVNTPSCMTGSSDSLNCSHALYKKMQARWRLEREEKLKQNESDDKINNERQD